MHTTEAQLRQARLQAFIDFKVKHPRLEEIDDTLMQAIRGHRTYTLEPRSGVLRFPSHDKRKTHTPNTEQRWAIEQTIWEVVGGERT